MRKIRPFLPFPCYQYGYLYDSDDVADLGQDMLDVVLPNGVLITSGWYPEGDSAGSYKVSVRIDLDELIAPLFSKDVDSAASDVAALAHSFYGPITSVSDAENDVQLDREVAAA